MAQLSEHMLGAVLGLDASAVSEPLQHSLLSADLQLCELFAVALA